MTGRRILRIAITSLQSLHLRKVSVSLLKPPRIMGSQNWGSQNPKQSLTSRFWEGPMILTANKNSEDSKKTPTFWVCISKLPWFHCWLVQVLLKHYQFLGFFSRQLPTKFPPPQKKTVRWAEEARDCNVGDPKVQKMAWASGIFIPLGTTNHVTPRFFILFFVG